MCLQYRYILLNDSILLDYPFPQSVEIAVFSSRNILDFTLSTFSKRYHFPNAGKMVRD